LRIIGGHRKGRIVKTPNNSKVRPTTDRAKEGLFNILVNRYKLGKVTVLDLFSGTGSISYEFASRGCQDIISVELDRRNASMINKNISQLDFGQIRILNTDAFKFLSATTGKWDIIFADPPYTFTTIKNLPDLVFDNQSRLKPGGIFILEHPRNLSFENHPHFTERRKYGMVNFSFFY
jgi:16S rRNA (guanine(966)-N(2))-methyltransferase RsmD